MKKILIFCAFVCFSCDNDSQDSINGNVLTECNRADWLGAYTGTATCDSGSQDLTFEITPGAVADHIFIDGDNATVSRPDGGDPFLIGDDGAAKIDGCLSSLSRTDLAFEREVNFEFELIGDLLNVNYTVTSTSLKTSDTCTFSGLRQ